MIFMITYRCHRGCPYCLVDAAGPEAPHMPREVFDRALELARRLAPQSLGVAGGEPFEHPGIEDWIEQLREGPWHRVGIATNGDRLLTDERLRARVTGKSWLVIQVTTHDAASRRDWGRCTDSRILACTLGCRLPTFFFPSAKARARLPEHRLDRLRRWQGEPLGRMCYWLRRLAQTTPTASPQELLVDWYARCGAEPSPCTFHVHPDGVVRAGPWDRCQPLGTVEEALADLPTWGRQAMLRLNESCLECQPGGKA